MNLADFTAPGLIIPELKATDAPDVIRELSLALQRAGRVRDQASFYSAVMNREAQASTDFGEGMAFPHARFAGLDVLSFAVGRSRVPLDWGGGGGSGVWLVILTAVPATDATQYLTLVSGLVRLMQDVAAVRRLRDAGGAEAMLEVFGHVTRRGSGEPILPRPAGP